MRLRELGELKGSGTILGRLVSFHSYLSTAFRMACTLTTATSSSAASIPPLGNGLADYSDASSAEMVVPGVHCGRLRGFYGFGQV
jgi:hypothetical protein